MKQHNTYPKIRPDMAETALSVQRTAGNWCAWYYLKAQRIPADQALELLELDAIPAMPVRKPIGCSDKGGASIAIRQGSQP